MCLFCVYNFIYLICSGIKWNFTKFIVDKNGQPVARHATTTDPFVRKSLLRKKNIKYIIVRLIFRRTWKRIY